MSRNTSRVWLDIYNHASGTSKCVFKMVHMCQIRLSVNYCPICDLDFPSVERKRPSSP